MAKPRPRLEKLTLDKDLDKVTLAEEASLQVMKKWRGLGFGFVFIVLTMVFAATYVTGEPGAPIAIAAAAIAGYMAMNIGANDVTNNVGAAVGARAISMVTALLIAAVFEIAGALIAGREVVSTIESGILDVAAMPAGGAIIWVMMAALISSAAFINIATYSGAPVSTTHSIIGGIMGAGVAAAGLHAVQWWSLAGITASWTVSPVLGGVFAALLLAFIKEFIIYRDDKIVAVRTWMPVLIATMFGAFTAYIVAVAVDRIIPVSLPAALAIGLAAGILVYYVSRPIIFRQSEGLDNRNQSLRKMFHVPLIFSAALLSFAHGANDVSNAIGPLSAIVAAINKLPVTDVSQVPFWVILIGALGISTGLLLFGPRLIKVVGEEITKLNPMRAFCVAMSTAVTVLVASAMGIPISSTHTAVGAVFGVGFFREWYTRNSKRRLDYVRNRTGHTDFMEPVENNFDEVRRRHLVRRSHFLTIVGAWVITLPASAALAAVVYLVLSAIFM
ncbi:inorganic phosphate transporter [Pararhizobium sp.]|uniref:inorganic phosphate transporter n=1 Tax=Pararhizobium sp. TaxID=1977563 RepID=UPI0027191EB2|nr:inorganic phosphate transporter [Pararhizobium sp.]MDO9415592.1 inorganic phosphate transporter [Pararhizobium sp.]